MDGQTCDPAVSQQTLASDGRATIKLPDEKGRDRIKPSVN
jgi:hypothetical protein